jgi:hypothetical protein
MEVAEMTWRAVEVFGGIPEWTGEKSEGMPEASEAMRGVSE